MTVSRKDLRRINFYRSSLRNPAPENNIVSGQMGKRDINTGRYQTTLNNTGTVPTRFIGQTNSRPQGYTTEIDLDGWGDS